LSASDLHEFFLGHLDELILLDLILLFDILVGHVFAGVDVDLQILDATAGCSVELVERGLLGFRRGG
jgi:hypothetical protein